ncbi:MAG TPA: diguanylate cyclase, partial [Azonexus sp.]|nr:diguanylate cyclase [Azonexus sp.]
MSAEPAAAAGSGLLPRQMRWVLLGGLFFIAYAATLVWMTYQAQSQRQEANFVNTRLEAEKLAAAVAYFIDERRNDLADLAGSAEVLAYFANQALGMPLEYGLRANLLSILGRMNRLQEGKHLGGETIYRRLALLAHNGALLAATDHAIREEADLLALIPPQSAQPTVVSIASTGEIAISAPVRHNDHLHGQVIAWISAEQLQQHFLSLRSESAMTILLPPEGEWRFSGGQIALSALSALSAESIASLSRLPAGHWREWPAGELAPDAPGVRASAIAVGDTPLRLVTLVPLDELHSPGISRSFLAAAAAVPVLVIVGLILLTRLYRANRKLIRQAEHVTRQHVELNVRNSDLEREIQQREEVEKCLREQQQQLHDKTTALEKTMAKAQYLAQYDSLTKLSNRMFFREGLRRAMARAVRNHNMLAVLFIDLDHFKRINDTLGHPAGDQLLQEAANRLEHAVRET